MDDSSAFHPLPDADPDTTLAAAMQAYDAGDYAVARAAYAQATEVLHARCGPDDPATLRAQRGLAAALLELGEYAAAQTLLEQVLATLGRLRDPEHPEVALATGDLSVARFGQGDPAGALRLAEQALATRERALGADHPDTIESLNNLAVILASQGQRERAVAIHTEALARCERSLGDHRRTVETLNGLAVKLAGNKATYARAQALYEQALALGERVFGPGHPTVAALMSNLAAVLLDLGEEAGARQLHERSLALHERVFGSDSQRTAWVLVNLGDLEQHVRNHAAAREHYTRALIIREAALSPQHPLTVQTLDKLVAALGDLGRDDPAAMQEALPLYQCLVALDETTRARDPLSAQGAVPEDPERAADRLHTLVASLADKRRRTPPTPVEQEALQRAAELEREADALLQLGEAAAARVVLEQAIALREGAQGPSHIDLVGPLGRLGTALDLLDQPGAALALRERAVEIQVQELGPGHPQVLLALAKLNQIVSRQYGPSAAAPILDRIVGLAEAAFGSDAPQARLIRSAVDRLRPPAATPDDPPPRSHSERREEALGGVLEQELLAGLDDVPWGTLGHAYGSAEDVPDLLRMLLSDEPEVRGDALDQLFGNIWHQGTVYEASAYAVPFLLRLLSDPRTPDRLALLHLLTSLTTGSSYLAVHHREDDPVFDWRAMLEKRDQDFDEELQRELGWVRAANEAVAEGLDLLFALFQNEAEAVGLRQQALVAVGLLPSRAAESLPRLQALLGAQTDPRLRTSLARTLFVLLDHGPESQRLFADLLGGAEVDSVRLIAAVGLLVRAGADAPEAARRVVLDMLGELGRLRYDPQAPLEAQVLRRLAAQRFELGPEDDPVAFGLAGLRAQGGEPAQAALLRALPLLAEWEHAEQAAMGLLDLAFNGGQPLERNRSYIGEPSGASRIEYWRSSKQPACDPRDLTPAQREILAALAAHDPLWECQSNLLELYGLPAERGTLRALLAL